MKQCSDDHRVLPFLSVLFLPSSCKGHTTLTALVSLALCPMNNVFFGKVTVTCYYGVLLFNTAGSTLAECAAHKHRYRDFPGVQ